jgi:hypothetical protein
VDKIRKFTQKYFPKMGFSIYFNERTGFAKDFT